MTPQTADTSAPIVTWKDVPAAIGLLSRLPVPVDAEHATARGARAAWAYPLAGLAVALCAGLVGQVAAWAGVPVSVAAGLALVTMVVITGALHEDGLSDAADGLWGGWDKARRLEIMKDSRIGAYGVIALVLSLGLRWQLLTLALAVGALWPALLVSTMVSRAMMVPVMARLPHARDGGLSHSVGRPSLTTSRIAEGIAALVTVVFLQWVGLAVLVVAVVMTVACAAIAKAKIGGQTGDILGATQQVCEIAVLITLVTLSV